MNNNRISLNHLCDKVYQIATNHGWHEEKYKDWHYVMLIITELSEAVNADRSNKRAKTDLFKLNEQTPAYNEEFPINLDDIWPIAYTRKDSVVKQLIKEFYEGIDFCVQNADNQFFRQKAEKYLRTKGRPEQTYYLSVSCAEYLVVRKSRQIFEVYRRIFHKVVNEGTNLMGLGKYYTMEEFCKMFGKTKHSFYGYMGNYREEFAMIGHVYYISKRLCMYLESRQSTEKMRISIREKSEKRQLSLPFADDITQG